MKNKNTIQILNYLPAIISTRKSINNLSSNVRLTAKESYILDFSGVSFISRSFADEFITYLKSADVVWKIKNANNNIKAMLDAVQKSQKSTLRDYDYVAINYLKTTKDLRSFLATI